MRILADTNVPEEYVFALRGDGHAVVYTRDVEELGSRASDDAICEHAESGEWALLSTDVKDFGGRDLGVPVFIAPQDMRGGEVQAAVARVQRLPFDPAETEPIWLSSI